jgi:thiaminase/transcriptional activator TenA
VGLEAELRWFEGHAATRGLLLDTVRHPTTEQYRALLDSLDTASPAASLTALWAIERAYLDAWLSAAPGGPPFAEFVAHWTTSPFAAYVADLADAADRALASTTASEAQQAEDAFVHVARLERLFWDVAWANQPR